MEDNAKREKIAAAKKKLKQFQKSGRARSVSRTRDSSEREVQKENEPIEKIGRKSSPVEQKISTPEITNSPPAASEAFSEHASPNNGDCERTTASTESLHQLSRQINGMLLESGAILDGDDSTRSGMQELEERNRDLAALLEKHVQTNEHLNAQNQQLREHSKALQDQLEAERNLFHEKQKKDIGSLKEQLQVHIQTIGILVAEKTELQSQVSQSQRVSDQRIEEIEELNGRLKASRQRVSDLERSLSTSSQSSQNLQRSAAEHSKEVERLKMDLYNSKKHKEELQQQTLELREQLQLKTSENGSLQVSVNDLEKRLEMAELYAQQLSSENENSQGNFEVLNNLQKERDSLVERLKQHEDLNQKLQQERDQVTEQYQQYTEQLRHQTQQLTQQITVLTGEREQLLNRQHDLEGSLIELQRKLEDYGNAPAAPAVEPQTPAVPPEVEQELESLRCNMAQATETLESQVRDNMQLSRLLEEKEDRISLLERTVEEMDQREGDQAQLLESVQSDRTALSRALTQNKDLKGQLSELQAGFVKMSNDNMEIVTRLQAEQHALGELQAQLASKDSELTDLKQMLSAKETEMSQLREASQHLEKESYQQDQIKDRLRHYEAQAQLVDTLQNELTSAQDMMEALTTQNSELRTMLIKATEIKPGNQSNNDGLDDDTDKTNARDEIIQSLQDTIKQLESERGSMYENLKEQRQLSDRLGIQIADLNEELIRKTADSQPAEGENPPISRSEYLQLRTAMEMIQEKYLHVMQDKAELSDKADQLEHLVLQLQGESETIGEYISLYHHQRALLQQRESQKNDYIAQLAGDREQLQDKLGELQVLVMQLLGERSMLHSYTEESHSSPVQGLQQHHEEKQHHRPANGVASPHDSEWPDYTSSESDTDSEVEPIVGGQQGPSTPDLQDAHFSPHLSSLPDGTQPNSAVVENGHGDGGTGDHHDEHHHSHYSHHHHHRHRHHSHHSHHEAESLEKDGTARKILTLLTELGHSHIVEQIPLIDRNFLPCKFCKGAVQIV
ncbi:hypothetical protein EGW08_005140 [Elysia chlorotica]|uniref:Golgin subfamily A conserved domain-containing protein n=1 Tax=Elysia chlorotica TaxID=188477 RepID=A0A3S0ZVN3_ELYCH|nr:hypothetical protein EGW08_005140 [Elysia chlorotica]